MFNKFDEAVQLPTENKECDIIAIAGVREDGRMVVFPTEFRQSTGIEAILEGKGVESVYNLQGVRLKNDINNLSTGIYIINGKPMYIKK